MQYKRLNNTICVRFDKGDELASCLLKIAQSEDIKTAKISGIGATDCLKVGVFDTSKGTYDVFEYVGDMEINSVCGNLTTMDGAPYVHLHVTATRGDGKVVGGHLLSAVISLTGEFFVDVVDGTVERKRDENLKINTWRF